MNDGERYAKGLEVRRAVLGDAHVDRALATATDLTAEFQDLITRYAWGEMWARPGLPRRTRSLVTIAMLVALNRPEELRLHLRASPACGVTREDLRELLLHAAVYCGVPAANAAFHLAEAELPPGPDDPSGERGLPTGSET
jgi:4-carboxymuconolactone decarboxylase